MTRIRMKGYKIYKDRHGKQRCYHRGTGKKIDLTKAPLGSAEFITACASLVSVETVSSKAGTLGGLIKDYCAAPAFRDLAHNTQVDYQRVFNYLKPLERVSLSTFDTPFVVKIRDKALEKHKWRFANKVKTTLSLLFSWGHERGYIKGNPAKGIKKISRPKNLDPANRPWSDKEWYTVLDEALWELKIPLAVMAYTGLDPTDSIKLLKSQYDGKNILTNRSKTGEEAWWPVQKALCAILDNAPEHTAETLAVSSKGKSWTYRGLASSFQRLRLKLEKEGKIEPNLTMKGLRHTMATILREDGQDSRTIADALAQKTLSMAEHYSRRADLKKKMTKVTKRLDKIEETRRKNAGRKVSNLSQKVSNLEKLAS